MIFLALPFFFVPSSISFPAGLLVYWITTNLWTIVQQVIVRKRVGPLRPPGSEPAPGLGELFKQARGQSRHRGRAAAARARRTASSSRAGAGGGAGQGEGAPDGAPARAAAEEEEALGAPTMSERDAGRARRGPASRASPRRSGWTRTSRSSRRPGRSAPSCTATTSGCSSAATARRSTPSSTSRTRSPRSRRTPAPRVEVDAAGYRERRRARAASARPTRPRRTPCARAGRSRSTR